MPMRVSYRRAMDLNGLPLHPLVVHAAVVLGPVAALTAIAYAVLPRWRWLLRWPMVGLAVATVGALFLSKLAGDALVDERFRNTTAELAEQIELHESRGEVLLWVSIAFLAIVVVAALTVGGPSGLASGAGARDSRGTAVTAGVLGLVVVGAVALVVMTYLTGDTGARAVWGL